MIRLPKENRQLAEARDTLLAKLMSGEVGVGLKKDAGVKTIQEG